MNRFSSLRIDPLLLPHYWRRKIHELVAACGAENTSVTLRTLLFALRDMPYARPNGPLNTAQECVTQWRGTCSAKHLAAYELLDSLGLSPKLWLASYRIDFTKPYYSMELRQNATGLIVHDVHNYVTCELRGRRTIVDVTFPARLNIHGLPVTKDWMEHQDFVLCCVPDETREILNLQEADLAKREWLQTLNRGEAATLREDAIAELMAVAKEAVPGSTE